MDTGLHHRTLHLDGAALRTRRFVRGVTLIEIMVALLVISIVTSAVVVSVGDVTGSRLMAAAGRLSAMCRYAYDLATIRGKIFRVAIDIDQGVLRIEELEQPASCGIMTDSQAAVRAEEEKSSEAKAAKAGKKDDEEVEVEGTGKQVADMQSKEFTIAKNLKIKGVITPRKKDSVESGVEYVHFFPDGTAEKAFVWLADGDDVLTIEVKPLMGTGIIVNEELTMEDFRKK